MNNLPSQQILNKRNFVVPILVVLVIISAGLAVYFYSRSAQPGEDSDKSAQQESEELVIKVGKLINLPEEVPTIATVTDPEALRGQPLFVNAKKGDKVLIFTNARKVILYDPVSNKIIEVAPLNIDQPGAVPAVSTTSKQNR